MEAATILEKRSKTLIIYRYMFYNFLKVLGTYKVNSEAVTFLDFTIGWPYYSN